MRWRPFFRALHRDVGYAVAALTLAYSVSGIAVNHIEDWNPNYAFRERPVELGVLPPSDLQAMQRHVVAGLAIDPDTVRGHFLESPSDFRVFLRDGR